MKNSWIKVEDRLPKKGERVLTYYNTKLDGDIIYCEVLVTKGGWRMNIVTHWMPLPEPPKNI